MAQILSGAGLQAGALIIVLTNLTFAADKFVLSFFRNNGEDGLYLAASNDGFNFTELNNGKPLIKPEVGESKLMRDPSIVRGPDGTFHMVWTTSWQGKTIGYAHSKDLRNWSPQQAITLFPDETGVQNCWAPELYYDAPSKDFIILWASTINDKFRNHRLYMTRTRDFRKFTKPVLLYDPGFMVIDGAIFHTGKRYAMVVKNETQTPPAKYLFLAYSGKLEGPWSKPGPAISGPQWAEGPSPIQINGYWYIYFDKYRDHKYGAIRSKDLEHWEDITEKITLPAGIRHGTVFRAPSQIIEPLQASAALKLQHVANAGVLLTCGNTTVAVDAFFREGVNGYQTIPAPLRDQMETAQKPYDNIRLILSTHPHRDHFDAASVARHLQHNKQAIFAGTPQLANPVRAAGASNVETITWPATRQWGAVTAKFLKLPHNPPHRDTIENSAIQLTLCGQTVLFTGDADMTTADFAALQIPPQSIHRLFAPWWMLTGDNGRRIIDTQLQPRSLWALHGDLANPERWQQQVRAAYPDATIAFDNRAPIQ
ncbi:MAG: family 43 glycosylhydrolase [Bryobacteraceae bacterium]